MTQKWIPFNAELLLKCSRKGNPLPPQGPRWPQKEVTPDPSQDRCRFFTRHAQTALVAPVEICVSPGHSVIDLGRKRGPAEGLGQGKHPVAGRREKSWGFC